MTREYMAAYYAANKERLKAKAAARRAANPEKARAEVRACWQDPEKRAKYLAKRAEWYPAYAPIARERAKKWAKENADKALASMNARTKLYKQRKSRRSPPWLSKQQIQEIAGFYAEAKRLSEATGVKHHVDHIVPLCGGVVSGLHVPWNLQILPASENQRKSNRLER